MTDRSGEEGYLLLGLVVACFMILLFLGVAAPRVAKELERDREVEAEHRALEYVRAIQLYYRRNNAYPTTVEQLLGTGTTGVAVAGTGQVRYLRQAYKDPLTNDEFRLIHVNEAKTQVKGFFGEPLQGMAPGLGALAGSTVNPGAAATAIGGSTPGVTVGNSFSSGSASTGTGASAGTGTSFGGSSTNASNFQGSKGAFVGVGSNGKGHGLVEWNGSEDIADWEFLYDPRVEQLKAKVSIFGGTPAANGSGSFGSLPGAPASSTGAPASGSGTPGIGTTGTGTPGTGTTTPAP